MPANSNFQQAIREAQSSALIGPNVVNKALPYVGGGMALTGLGVLGGLSLQATNNPLFGPLFIVAFIAEIVLFFIFGIFVFLITIMASFVFLSLFIQD